MARAKNLIKLGFADDIQNPSLMLNPFLIQPSSENSKWKSLFQQNDGGAKKNPSSIVITKLTISTLKFSTNQIKKM